MRRVAAAALAIACAALLATPAARANPVARSAATDSVRVDVVGINPYAPAQSSTPEPISFTLDLTNTSSTTLADVQVSAERGNPVTTQERLGRVALAPSDPSADDLPIAASRTVTATLPPGVPVRVTFSTTTSIIDNGELCQCSNAVYPIFFTVNGGKTTTALGAGGTYVPVYTSSVRPVQVAWLWPLIDRPHRLLSESVFTDDALAAEVAGGGRLDRALQVAENVGGTVPLTLVIDPELIDELAVMASGTYRVRSGRNATTAGTGAAAAASWLQRLHDLVTTDSGLDVELTAYADPDIPSVVAHGSTWQAAMPSDMTARVTHALEGTRFGTDLAWPAGERVTKNVLSHLTSQGTRRLVVASTGLNTGLSADLPSPGVVALKSGTRTVPTLVLASRLAALVESSVATGQDGVLALPRLLAELTIRSTEAPTQQAAVLAPTRYVDPDVAAASTVIESTSTSSYTTAATTAQLFALTGLRSAKVTGRLPSSGGLPAVIYDAVHALQRSSATIRSLLTVPATASRSARENTSANALLAELPAAVQRVESSAWRSQGGLSATIGSNYADTLSQLLDGLRSGVRIVPPATGAYTLASTNSDLPVTVENDLDYPVTVDVRLETIGNVPGLRTTPLTSKTIPARAKVILRLPASVDRTGRIRVQAYLTAPNGSALGSPIRLSVHSTAFGVIGIVITVVAGLLLLLALARRWYRSARLRRRRAQPIDQVAAA